MAYYDQPTFGSILDIIEQEAEISFQAVDYDNFQPGKPFRSGQLSIPETANNRAILGSLFDADGSNKTRIIEGATYQNDAISLQGSIVITGQTYEKKINILTGFFVSGNALLWLDFGDLTLQDVNWSDYNHVLNFTNVQLSETEALNDLVVYDICDRGKFIDDTVVDLIERYPAFNIASMLRRIFRGYDLQSNFLTSTWFTKIYLLFTGSADIRNTEDFKESALVQLSGGGGYVYTDTDLNAWTDIAKVEQFSLVDTGTDDFDNGLNFDPVTHVYTVPETGTYRFKTTISGTILTDDGTGTEADMRFNSGGGNPKIEWYFLLNGTTVIGLNSTQEYDFSSGSVVFTGEIVDTDFLELTAADTVELYWSITGQYFITSPPATGFEMTTAATAVVTNQVSRYYGYGSTVDISKLMPTTKVNDWLSELFQHFGITPQYSNETNIIRLDTWARQTTGTDLSYSLDPLTGQAEYMEPFNYEVRFAVDSSDQYGSDWFKRNEAEDGNYRAENGEKVLRVFQSAYSNTVMQKPYRLQIGTDALAKIPVLWQDIPKSAWFSVGIILEVPAWRTNFNQRLLLYSGLQAEKYNFAYHVAVTGRTVTDEFYAQLTPYDSAALLSIEFADRTGYIGLHERCHKAQIARINNGLSLTIQGVVPLTYLNDVINCDSTVNLRTSVYINFEPFVGYYTVQKLTTDGVISQLQLIRNDE